MFYVIELIVYLIHFSGYYFNWMTTWQANAQFNIGALQQYVHKIQVYWPYFGNFTKFASNVSKSPSLHTSKYVGMRARINSKVLWNVHLFQFASTLLILLIVLLRDTNVKTLFAVSMQVLLIPIYIHHDMYHETWVSTHTSQHVLTF